MTEAQQEQLIKAINDMVEAQLDYVDNHLDSGDGYSHMPCEGWDQADGRRLQSFILDNNIKTYTLNIDDLSTLALNNFDMVSRHFMHSGSFEAFDVGTYLVGEIEVQIDYTTLSNKLGFTVTSDHIDKISNDVDSYIIISNDDYFLAYVVSDNVWAAQITKSDLQQLINSKTGN